MKSLHRQNLYGWSQFDAPRNMDFNTTLWVRPEGNVVFDPVPISEHDAEHLAELGGVAWILLTTSDHVRATRELAQRFGANVAGPAAERETFPMTCDAWVGDGDAPVRGAQAVALAGSKTPGELTFVLEDHTLVTGDLIRAPRGGQLALLPEAKLQDASAARASVRRLLDRAAFDAVLVGDGWHAFRDARGLLEDALRRSEL